MIEINLETRIAAPIERVFDLMRDVEAHVETTSGTGEQVVSSSAKLLGMNDTVTFRARHFGIWQSLSARVIEFEPPVCLIDVQTKGAFKSLRHEHRFREEGNITVMTDRLQIEAPLGPLGWIAERLFLKSYMRNFLIRKNQALKELAESSDLK
jgi:ligand-binding SRPBCC domain-containing protein